MSAFPWDQTCLWCGYVRRVHRKEDFRCPDPRSMDAKGWHHSNSFKAFPSSIPSDPENYQGPGNLSEEAYSNVCQDTIPDSDHPCPRSGCGMCLVCDARDERDMLRAQEPELAAVIGRWKIERDEVVRKNDLFAAANERLEAERDELKSVIRAVIGAIDSWKVPLLDPDGNDSSEAVMRLVAHDLRRVLGMKTFDEAREARRGRKS